ncbi:MAG: hypothetical protein U1G07_23700 [Verrucomicrobiota bacterium]
MVQRRHALLGGGNQTLSTTLRHNGESAGQVKDVRLTAEFSDFADAVMTQLQATGELTVRRRLHNDILTTMTILRQHSGREPVQGSSLLPG